MAKALSFDTVEVKKIGKGALIAGAGAVAIYLLSALGTLDISDPFLTSLVAWLVPTATNAIKQFLQDNK